MKREDVTKDHVVGRKFVPKGKMNNQWNLIANSCRECNNRKSDLEDDISAITLFPDMSGLFSYEDVAVVEDARRRAIRSISRKTRKVVCESIEKLDLKISLAPGAMTEIQFTAPPQVDDFRIFQLAKMHMTALFFMQTYDSTSKRGGYWMHGFYNLISVRREDWGNMIMKGFIESIDSWELRLRIETAEGFFKAMTRRHPSAECWAWALEWNRSFRIIGFFGEKEPAEEIAKGFSRQEIHTIFEDNHRALRYSLEVPLAQEEDNLFPICS